MIDVLEFFMENTTLSFVPTGVIPPVRDAEAAERRRSKPMANSSTHGFPVLKIRSVMAELCSAIRSALDDERGTAEDSLRRAAEILQEMDGTQVTTRHEVRGGLSPWQI